MINKLKVLGMAFFAILAIGGASASAASAAEFKFEKAGSYPAIKNVSSGFTVNGLAISCSESANLSQVAGLTAPSLSFTPTTECLGGGVKWNYNGCSRKIVVNTATTGTFSFVCPAGKEIDMEAKAFGSKCHFYIPAQTPTSPNVTFGQKEVKGKKAVDLGYQVKGITFTNTINCDQGGPPGVHDGLGLIGNVTVVAFSDKYYEIPAGVRVE